MSNKSAVITQLKTGTYKGIQVTRDFIYISIAEQKLFLIERGVVSLTYAISSSKAGVGTAVGSNTTPAGLHSIAQKIGDNLEIGTIIAGRIPQKEKAIIYKDKTDAKTDFVTTRLMWLTGLELSNKNSYSRFVYIHGTPEEGLIGTPQSHGCIRMRNFEVAELYNFVQTGITVLIDDGKQLPPPAQAVVPIVAKVAPVVQKKTQQGAVPYFTYIHLDSAVATLAGVIKAKGYKDITPTKILAIKGNPEAVFAAYKPIQKLEARKAGLKIISNSNIVLPNSFDTISNGAIDPLNPNRINLQNNLTTPTAIPQAFDSNQNQPIEPLEPGIAELKNIAVGTRLLLPNTCLPVNNFSREANRNLIPAGNTEAYISRALSSMLEAPGYDQVYTINGVRNGVTKATPKATVWVWVKALGEVGSEPGINGNYSTHGKIIDISRFVESLNIQVGPTGGSFNFNLPPITCAVVDSEWHLKPIAIHEFEDERGNDNYVSRDSLFQQINGELRANYFYLHNVIAANDIVWIRFEALQNEEDRLTPPTQSDFVSRLELPGKTYDMIGLVDRNTLKSDYDRTGVTVSVSGRDLIKLVIEDSSTWLCVPNQRSFEGIFYNANWKKFGRPVRRLDRLGPANNELAFMIQFIAPTIGQVIDIVFGSLATLEIAPDELFSAYPEKYNPVTGQEPYSKYPEYVGDKRKMVRGAGIWQIIKVLVDDAVSDRILADNSISTYEGSLLNGIQKYVQAPFVEMFTDTYKDQFYFIIREPPTNYKGYKSLVDICNTVDGLRIAPEQVMGDSLSFDDSEVYCWYHLQPVGAMTSTSLSMYPEVLPTVYFREYNEIWGNRSMDIVSNYLHAGNVIGKKTKNDSEYVSLLKQIEYDMRYMVESHAYTPFTRKGTITLEGDRRIKRGLVIFYELTGEYYYVDAVANTFNTTASGVQRTTTLTVTRGMVDKLPNGSSVLEYYFNIIDFKATNFTDVSKPAFDWSVRPDVFNFFIRRLQFSNDPNTTIPSL